MDIYKSGHPTDPLCPECGELISIESDEDDHCMDIEETRKCPHCRKDILIKIEVQRTLHKVNKETT